MRSLGYEPYDVGLHQPPTTVQGRAWMVHNVVKPPKTIRERRKLGAVFPPATQKDGVAWHTFGIGFPLHTPLRKAGRYPLCALPLITGFFILDTHCLSCSASFYLFFFSGPFTKGTGYENLELFAKCAGVSCA